MGGARQFFVCGLLVASLAGCGGTGGFNACDAAENERNMSLARWGHPAPDERPEVAWTLQPDVGNAQRGGFRLAHGLVLGFFSGCNVIAVDARTGEPQWVSHTDFGAAAQGERFSEDEEGIRISGNVLLDRENGEVLERDGDTRYAVFDTVAIREDFNEEVVVLEDGERRAFDSPWSDLYGIGPESPPTEPSDLAVHDRILYLYSGADRMMYAVDLADGSVVWTLDAAAAGFNQMSAVASLGGRLFACGEKNDSATMVQLDRATGAILTRAEMRRSEPPADTGCGRSAPVVGSGTVLHVNLDGVWAIDAQSGSLRWSRDDIPAITGTVTDQRLHVAVDDWENSLFTLDLATGATLHEVSPLPRVGSGFHDSPMVGPDGLLILHGGGGRLIALHLGHLV